MILSGLSYFQVERVRQWRNEDISGFRTPFPISEAQQKKWFESLDPMRDRFFAIMDDDQFIGMAGLTGIQWENGRAEISLIIGPHSRKMGYGTKAVDLLLSMARGIGLKRVFGEVYTCSPAYGFWRKLIKEYNIPMVSVEGTKTVKGMEYNSIIFWFRV